MDSAQVLSLPLTPWRCLLILTAGCWLHASAWTGKATATHTFDLMPITSSLNNKIYMLIMSLAGPSLGPDVTCLMFTLSNTGCSLRLALGSAGSVPLNSLTYVSCLQIAQPSRSPFTRTLPFSCMHKSL